MKIPFKEILVKFMFITGFLLIVNDVMNKGAFSLFQIFGLAAIGVMLDQILKLAKVKRGKRK